MKLVLAFAPFCTPASPPYTLVQLHSFLLANGVDAVLEDLNVQYHYEQYPKVHAFLKSGESKGYGTIIKEFLQESRASYGEQNKAIRRGEFPKNFEALIDALLKHKPTHVAFSVIYSSQVFYVHALTKRLQEQGVKVIVGGPAVSTNLKKCADQYLRNEVELLEYCTSPVVDHHALSVDNPLNFSLLPLDKYFVPSIVLPIRTTSSCYYQKCAFCTHHKNVPYTEFSLDNIIESIRLSDAKHVFFTDDMIHKQRLLQIAERLSGTGVTWMCQLRPVKELDKETLQTLYDAGLRHVIWGVESGSDRILNLMKKGTNGLDAAKVLADAKEVGITNATYIMFGFPSETKDEFLMTMDFLDKNREVIDLVSTSVFGLQEEAPMFSAPENYDIDSIEVHERELLDASVTYTVKTGLSNAEARRLRRRYSKTLNKLNKCDKHMNFFREHVLCLCTE